MGVKLGVAQNGRDALFQPFTDDMFQNISLFMNFIPAKSQRFVEIKFQQPVMTLNLI